MLMGTYAVHTGVIVGVLLYSNSFQVARVGRSLSTGDDIFADKIATVQKETKTVHSG